MQNVSDKPVKWLGDDGGWRVGFPVLKPDGRELTDGFLNGLIRETPCGTLSWVDYLKCTDYVVPPEFK